MIDRRMFIWKLDKGEWKYTSVSKIVAGDIILGADFDAKENVSMIVKSAIPIVAPHLNILLSDGQRFCIPKTPDILTEFGWVEPVKNMKIIHARHEPYVVEVRHQLLGYNFVDILVDKDYPVIANSGYYFKVRS